MVLCWVPSVIHVAVDNARQPCEPWVLTSPPIALLQALCPRVARLPPLAPASTARPRPEVVARLSHRIAALPDRAGDGHQVAGGPQRGGDLALAHVAVSSHGVIEQSVR